MSPPPLEKVLSFGSLQSFGWGTVGRRGVSEDALCYLKSFLLHAGEGGAGAVLDFDPFGKTASFQYKVIVGSGVHSVKDVGVIRDLQL